MKTMKTKYRLFGVIAILIVLAGPYSRAADSFDPEVCFDRCMERVKDKQKCEFICDSKNHPPR
ncbi:hypothetical protein ACQ859_15215 [Roseateles chitinivorans]|uniref:hypothetical protein n=1 Tax=Roseateles chitinivorans TaxID=2917965 RepID=UPI003D67B8F8